MRIVKLLLTLNIIFFLTGSFLGAQGVPRIQYEGTSNSPNMVRYRQIYEKKSADTASLTILYNFELKKVGMSDLGTIGVGERRIIAKPHNANCFLIGDKKASGNEVKSIAEFIYLEEALALTKGVVNKTVRDCWDYYKYSICLFLKEDAIRLAMRALREKDNKGEKIEVFTEEAIAARNLYQEICGPARFNIELAGKIPDVTKDSLTAGPSKARYTNIRNLMKYSSDTPTVKIEKQRAVSLPKRGHQETKNLQGVEKITPSSSLDEINSLPDSAQPKHRFNRGFKDAIDNK